MTRSILWISSRPPPSPVSIAWLALPQPRSRMALAAETRAAAVASFERMTPTSTLSAVLVWLRASERISVSVLAKVNFPFRSEPGALFAVPVRMRDQPDDFDAHENPSTTAIATKPISASDIK